MRLLDESIEALFLPQSPGGQYDVIADLPWIQGHEKPARSGLGFWVRRGFTTNLEEVNEWLLTGIPEWNRARLRALTT